MKLNPSKSALALGIALSILVLLCMVISFIGGKDFSLNMLNILFHHVDFKKIMIDSEFNIGRLLGGMLILFTGGIIVGYSTAIIYNALNRNKLSN